MPRLPEANPVVIVGGYELAYMVTDKAASTPYTVVSFFTDDPLYREVVENLHDSLLRHRIESRIFRLPPFEKWEHACAHKARFIRSMRDALLGPLVWLDADAVVKKPPVLFNDLVDLKADFAVHQPQRGVDPWFNESSPTISGTIFIGTSPEARNLLRVWERYCEARPDIWDQVHLYRALEECRYPVNSPLPRFTNLPASYMRIFDQRKMPPEVVIEHRQASRRAPNKTRRK